jgi:excinuclease ABC subunit C
VKITVPRRGHKRDLLDVAVENAAETMRALKAAHAAESQDEKAAEAIDSLGAALELPRPPRRIECYDISNLQGTHTVGAMVVFENAAPLRSDYRHFRIRSVAGQDDFASMREMLTRRFERLARARAGPTDPEAEPGAFERSPDLVLIDGGKGQLAVAVAVLQTLGLDDLSVAALAKRHEELFLPRRSESVYLPRDSQALFLVQRLRDETHRFAISYNRKLRSRAGLRSSLDEVPGIGGKRRRALLVHFGSLDGIRAASVDELAAVPGMSRRAAEQVKAYL